MILIDRRKNPTGKSLPNTQRFLDRAQQQIKESVNKAISQHDISDVAGESGVSSKNVVRVSGDGIHEPHFHFERETGIHTLVIVGNPKELDGPEGISPAGNYNNGPPNVPFANPLILFREGDYIYKPPQGGGGRGRKGSPDGDGIDDFQFLLTNDEWMNYFFDGLELPNKEEKILDASIIPLWAKAGYNIAGSPANLAISKTLRNSFGRRIALKRPKPEELEKLEKELDNYISDGSNEDETYRFELEQKVLEWKNKMERVPYIDPVDVRYYNHVAVPRPMFKAVMFCLMDVSGSMSSNQKDLAKRFYVLLYKFLKTKYEQVDVVFIRHTHEAKIVDEHTFFYDPETGGTIVSTALNVMKKEIEDRYSPLEWNIYCAQASDGDNSQGDNEEVEYILKKDILPITQYYAYIEVSDGDEESGWRPSGDSELWQLYQTIVPDNKHMALAKVKFKKDIYPVFCNLFKKRESNATH